MRVIIAARLSKKVDDRDQTGLDTQERETVAWAAQHGYEVVAVVADHKTGRSGLDARPNLRPWVTDPVLLSKYDAIAALKVDRLTRGDREETSKLEDWARENSKRLLITEADVHFPSEGVDGIRWDMMLRMAHEEWLRTSERYSRMRRYLRETGSAAGRPPVGYSWEKRNGVKVYVKNNDAGRVRKAFEMSIAGKPLAAIVAATGISETTIQRVIRNPAYKGLPHRKDGSPMDIAVDPIVSPEEWATANAGMIARARPGRSTSRHGKPLLKPVCKCGGTMYRHLGGKGHALSYYRCKGVFDPESHLNKPCAYAVRMDALDAAVMEIATADTVNFYRERVFVPGDDSSAEVDRLRSLAMDAYRRGDKAEFQRLDAEADEAAAKPGTPSRWADMCVCSCGKIPAEDAWDHYLPGHHVVTIGEHIASLGPDDVRDELAKWTVKVSGNHADVKGPYGTVGSAVLKDEFSTPRS